MDRPPNPIRLLILYIGLGLARLGLIGGERARRTADLAWPRIVTGIARMSKNAVDVAMVGIAIGPAAIAGVGFASPFWGLAFGVGGGIAGGTIALVSQRYGAEAYGELGQAVRSSALLVLVFTLPLTVVFWRYPTELISLISDDAEAIRLGADYLRVVGFGIPFAGLNLVGSRIFVGLDDARTPMMFRGGGAVANIVLNATFIFVLEFGVVGAAMGTVLSNAAAASAFAVALVAGRFPGLGSFPVRVDPLGSYLHLATLRDLIEIGLPVMARGLVWTVAEFPMLGIVDIFGQNTVAAYVIARRIWGLMNVPGWGFGLAASSLVGRELGANDEGAAESYGREIMLFAFATYFLSAVIVFAFAEPIVNAFVGDASDPAVVEIGIGLVYAACFAIPLKGISSGASGALEASGDTQWTFYSQAAGMFGCAIPLAYLGAAGLSIPAAVSVPLLGSVAVPLGGFSIPALGLVGLYLGFISETAVPAAINYWRFSTDKWKAISRAYRPDAAPSDD
ncbi:MATE family efflux transporter [Saliphagus sp. LR7]|uniref:MATE family efflux transporter n=1 Tax=Saliphagus sp. LR7 TaxID=2282654 RepID=UPI000DF73AC1|nr:MATE family efflux transporter [Saliphagus sp. LR7]